MTLRAAIYARQSLDRTGEGMAVTRQLAECRDLAQSNRWKVTEEYVDNDVSASSRKPRPEWTRLLAELEAGAYDVLVCWHTDRLYRRLRDLVDLVEIAESKALRIASVRAADLDLSTPAGRMLAGMLGHAQRYEVEQKSARQVAANRQARAAGRMPWTRRPYGYELDDTGTIVVVPAEADELRAAAKLALDGASLAGIARDLNDRGMATSTGGPWSVVALKRLLVNPRHAGQVTYLGDVSGVGAWEPIFTQETHEQLVAALTDPSRRTAPDTRAKHLLSGIALCGRCGGPLYGSPGGGINGKPRYLIYRCRTPHLGRRMDFVDEVVTETLLARLSRPDAVAALAGDQDEDTAALASEIARLREQLDGLGDLYAEGALTAAGLRDASAKLKGRLGSLQQRLAASGGNEQVVALATSEDLRSRWDGLPLRHRRAVIDALMLVTVLPVTRGARFEPEQVAIEWRTGA
jgi:DNA invertase Pin-like site-specific DNA recombinase